MSEIAHAKHAKREVFGLRWPALVGSMLIVACFFPAAFMHLEPWSLYLWPLTRIAVVASVFIYLYRVHIDLIGGLASAFFGSMCISISLNGGALDDCLLVYGPLAASLLFARAMVPAYQRELLWAMLIVTGSYAVVNLIVLCVVPTGTEFLHPNEDNTFLSYRNGFCRYYLPAIAAALLLNAESERRIPVVAIVLVVVGLAQSLIAYSATSILALAVFIPAMTIVFVSKKGRRILNAVTFDVAYVVLFIGIVILRFQNLFAGAIGAMGRNITFTGRTYVWDAALALLDNDHVLFGYLGVPGRLFVLPNGQSVATAHNAILDVTVWGGVIALGLFLAIILVVSIRLFRLRSQKSAAIVSVYLGTFLVMGLMEYITCTAFFLFLGIAYALRSKTGEQRDVRASTDLKLDEGCE